MTAVLELTDVGRRYGELRAVDSVTLAVEAGSRHALIGPNGAGKSTLFHLISGTVRATSGRIRFLGTDVTRRSPHRRTQLGMGRTFQHSSLFDELTAHENVAIAVQRKLGHAPNAVLPTTRFPDVEARSEELLALVGLADLGDVDAGSLSYGHRRALEIALALATEPRLLLLDEPTAGMSRDETQRFRALIGALPERAHADDRRARHGRRLRSRNRDLGARRRSPDRDAARRRRSARRPPSRRRTSARATAWSELFTG